MRWPALSVASLLATGCSFLYDADDLRQPPPDATPVDADPSQLAIEGAAPAQLFEGTGGEGGRPAAIVVTGDSIAGDALVELELGGEPLAAETTRVAGDGRSIGLLVRLPVLGDLADGETRALTITVSQAGVSDSAEIEVRGLDELTLSTSPVAESTLADLYSHIEVTGPVHVTGTQPVQFRATGSIVIGGLLDVDASGQTPGPHGCAGGAAQSGGGCGSGGGDPGADQPVLGAGDGGGGGGFGVEADGGGGDGGGAGGGETGNPMLVPIVTASGPGNRGNGGGGGGDGTLNPGGAGGGGGGVLEVSAGGDLEVTGGGALRARGGDGAGAGGGGGGGSGGAILVRAGGAITAGAAWLSAPGGGTTGNPMGGPGAIGRIRVDAPAGGVAAMATLPAAVAGPAWDPETPAIVDAAALDVTLRGASGRPFGIRVNDAAVTDVIPGGAGTATVGVTLIDGRNELCAVYTANDQAVDLDKPEARTCVEILLIR